MPVTIDEIAKNCNLSRSSVAQVLRNPHNQRFPHETRQRIIQAAAELHYVPNSVSRQLRNGKTNVISLVLPYIKSALPEKVAVAAERLGYEVSFQISHPQEGDGERHELTKAVERRVSGIIWFPAYQEPDAYSQGAEQVRENGIPTVLLEAKVREFPNADVVSFDMVNASDQVVEHFAEQGYRTILYFCYPTHLGKPKEDVKHFISAARKQGLRAKWLRPLPLLADNYRLLTDYLNSNVEMPVGIYCEIDSLALCALTLVKSRGLAIPEDVGVVTNGDVDYVNGFPLGEITDPPECRCTTIW